MLQAERFYGAAWFYNPARWDTSDGYVPFHVCWAYWHAMEPLMAFERLFVMRAVQLGISVPLKPEVVGQLADAEIARAFPQEG
jgi:hypothetical protein